MKKTIPVIGMACSVCSANVEKKLQSLEGINSASVSLANRTALVDYRGCQGKGSHEGLGRRNLVKDNGRNRCG